MGIITSGNHPKALWPGINKWWGRKYDEHATEYDKIFDIRDSNKSYEETVEVTGFGLAPVKTQGGSVSYDSESQGAISRFINVVYALGYIVTREEIEDNLYEEVSMTRAAALAFSMRQTKETVHANILNRAFNSSYTGGDGKELCATDHPTKSGTQSNELAVAADLSEASVEDLLIQIMGTTNSKGLKINLMGECLIIPRQLFYEATRILKSVLQNDTANNAVNALKSANALPKGIVMNHYLTDPDAWFIKTNCPEGMTSFQRRETEFTQDNDFDTENAKAKCTERYVPGWSDFRGIAGSPGA